MTGFRHNNPFRRHNMAMLDHDESALQSKAQPLFYRLGHRSRGLPCPDHDDMLIAAQVIPTLANDQFFAVPGDSTADCRTGVYRS
jgi:hypothetical protein